MDMNGIVGSSFSDGSFWEAPVGFGVSLAMNDGVISGYARLTEAEKEQVILRCKAAKTKGQMQKIVDTLVPGTDMQEIFEEEKDSFS